MVIFLTEITFKRVYIKLKPQKVGTHVLLIKANCWYFKVVMKKQCLISFAFIHVDSNVIKHLQIKYFHNLSTQMFYYFYNRVNAMPSACFFLFSCKWYYEEIVQDLIVVSAWRPFPLLVFCGNGMRRKLFTLR